jgi:hypothetical protein
MDKSDKEWINKYMEETFNKFQWSIFPKEAPNTQFVVRGNDFEQFVVDVEAIKRTFLEQKTAPVVPVQPVPEAVPAATKICANCGSKRTYKEGINKAGKPYKGWFCPLPKAECGATPIWVSD